MDCKSMFWGVVLKPDKRYEQIVEESFHISKACLEPSSAEDGKVTSVYIEKESDEFIICNLEGNNVLSENLDLNFNEGEKICFRAEGGATVHLTGYIMEDDTPYDNPLMMSDMSEGLEEEEESAEEEETPKLVKKRKLEVNGHGDSPARAKKNKGEVSALDKLLAESKSKSKDVKQAQAMKKILEAKKKAGDDEDDDEDDSDDMDEDMDDAEEEDSDEEEESGEEEEEDEDDEEEEEEVVNKTPQNKKGKKEILGSMNGTPKPKDTPKGKKEETPKGKKEMEKQKGKTETPMSKKKEMNGQEKSPKTPKRTLKGGIQVEDIKVGNGPEAIPGKHIGMYYKGQLKSGKTFDSCLNGKPFKFKLGKGEVIKGWDVGISGMKVGGKRRLTIPPQLGYGSQGAPPDIPPNSTLMFEVECKMVN